MAAACLTKLKGDTKPLFDLLENLMYQIKASKESGRKEKQNQGSVAAATEE